MGEPVSIEMLVSVHEYIN